ncbi:MAG TPA: substrate-binding domain-containing protein [Bacillota bacterium]|nr:substrate-binding domain-containing protein [Bacillota bacterium]
MKYWVLGAVILFLMFAVFFVYNTSLFLWQANGLTYHAPDLRKDRYHFVMITRAADEDYWKQAHQGAEQVAQSEHVALEYYGPSFLDFKELERFLEMAVLSSVDGILLSAPNAPAFTALINEAADKGIPVVILFNEIDGTRENSFVGINTFDLGFKTGEALRQAVTGNVQVAVLVNSNFSSTGYQRYLAGIKQAIQAYPGLQLKLVLTSKGSSVSAEEQTQTILTNYPEIQAIVCSDVSDTLGVAKVVVDLNRVTQVTILGSGLTPEIANYIERGVIWGVLADEPEELGAQGMSTLIRMRQDKSGVKYYDMPLFLIHRQNLDKYYDQFLSNPEQD